MLEGLEVSGLLDTGATKIFIGRELIRKVPDHPVVQHAAADMLQIRLPHGEEVQIKDKITLESNIEKLSVTFEAHLLSII